MSPRWPVDPAAVAAGLEEADELLRADPEFAAEVQRMRAVVARLDALDAEAWRPAPPPALALPTPAPPVRRRRRFSFRIAAPLAAAAAAAALAIVVLAGADDRIVELDPLPGTAGTVEASVVVSDGGEVRLEVAGAQPTPPGYDEELWYLDGDRLVSLGKYRVGADGRAEARFSTQADLADYRFVDVSRERDDGDPGHSAQSLLRSDSLS